MSRRDPFTTSPHVRAPHDPPVSPRKAKTAITQARERAEAAEADYQRFLEHVRLQVWGRP